MKWVCTVVLIYLSSIALALSNEILLYLNPEARKAPAVYLKDIAKVESVSPEDIGAILIPERLYNDGYIDADEIRNFMIEENIKGTIRIFGSAVRIRDDAAVAQKEDSKNEADIAIQHGDRVDIIVRKKGITVQTAGTALTAGKKGDKVFVKTVNARRLPGKITGRGEVEVDL
jgi:hypothetical protein